MALAHTAIVDHGNPGAWYGTLATVPATTVACATTQGSRLAANMSAELSRVCIWAIYGVDGCLRMCVSPPPVLYC